MSIHRPRFGRGGGAVVIVWAVAAALARASTGTGSTLAAETGALAADTDALAALSRGDEAWWRGDRGDAQIAWREALDASVEDPTTGRATEAMARIRLLQLGGNVAPFVHESKLNAALRACPPEEPWCRIAEADWDLFMPRFTGADPTRVPDLLAGSPLVGPAAARIAVATGDLAALDSLPDSALDGMGRGLRATGRRTPPAPGTWVLGFGVGGAPGAGVGFALRFVHPDLAWQRHRLELIAGADTRGGMHVSGSVVTATRPALVFGVGAARTIADVWFDGVPTPYDLASARLSAAVAPQWGLVGVTLGGVARAEWLGGVQFDRQPWFVGGPTAGVTLGNRLAHVRVTGELNGGAYELLVVSADGRAAPPVAGGTLALRVAATHIPLDSTDGGAFYRLPTAGGADLLRGLPAGRFRGDTVLAGQVEYRHPIWGPLHGAVFVDTANVEGWHVTAGGGLRIVLPPDRDNVTRIDVGVGPEGWGVVAAWGEAF